MFVFSAFFAVSLELAALSLLSVAEVVSGFRVFFSESVDFPLLYNEGKHNNQSLRLLHFLPIPQK